MARITKEQQIAAEAQLALAEAVQRKTVSLESIDFGACREKIKNPHQFCEFKFKKFQDQEWSEREKIVTEAHVCRTGSTGKQKRHLLLVSAGMGSGKSRVLTELHNIIEPELDEGSILIELRVNFENGMSVQDHEHSTDNRARVVEKALLDRIMFHLLGKEKEKEVFDTFCEKQAWGFGLAVLVQAIQSHMETVENKKVFVLVSVDGVHNLDQRDGEYLDQGIYNEGDRTEWYKRSALREVLFVLQQVLHSVSHVCVLCPPQWLSRSTPSEAAQTSCSRNSYDHQR